MTKRSILISVDNDILNFFDRMVGKNNRSKEIERLMSFKVGSKTEQGVKKEILQLKIKKLSSELAGIKMELDFNLVSLQSVESLEQEEELKRLACEEEKVKNLKTCSVCGRVFDDDQLKKFSFGVFCRNCFGGDEFIRLDRANLIKIRTIIVFNLVFCLFFDTFVVGGCDECDENDECDGVLELTSQKIMKKVPEKGSIAVDDLILQLPDVAPGIFQKNDEKNDKKSSQSSQSSQKELVIDDETTKHNVMNSDECDESIIGGCYVFGSKRTRGFSLLFSVWIIIILLSIVCIIYFIKVLGL